MRPKKTRPALFIFSHHFYRCQRVIRHDRLRRGEKQFGRLRSHRFRLQNALGATSQMPQRREAGDECDSDAEEWE